MEGFLLLRHFCDTQLIDNKKATRESGLTACIYC